MTDKSDLLRALRIDRGNDADEDARIEHEPPRVSRLIYVASLCVVAIASAGVTWLLKPAPAPPPAAVDVAAPPPSLRQEGLVASGYVVARRRATVAAQVTGRLVEVRVEEGQRVRQGDVIAVLEPTLARAELSSARARAAAAEAEMSEAGRVFERTRSLAGRGFASDAALTEAQSRYELAIAQRDASRSDAQRAEAQLRLHQIQAPFSGIVVNKSAQPGEIISPMSAGGGFTRTGVCTIVDMSSLEIEVDVAEASIARVVEGQRVEAVLDAYPNSILRAHVIATIPSADRSRATVRVRIAFDELDPRILPEMAIRVRFLMEPS